MKPRYPLMQGFDELPGSLPLYTLENVLLPGGELPLELSEPEDLALFLHALRTDQLIGIYQPAKSLGDAKTSRVGCAGRIRQYRERKDGRIDIMLTGLCRYRVVEKGLSEGGFCIARVDWRGFEIDYRNDNVNQELVESFRRDLRDFFDRFRMSVDWEVLQKLPVEQLVNNLVLVVNLEKESKQQLLEAVTVADRLKMFSQFLRDKKAPISVNMPSKSRIN